MKDKTAWRDIVNVFLVGLLFIVGWYGHRLNVLEHQVHQLQQNYISHISGVQR